MCVHDVELCVVAVAGDDDGGLPDRPPAEVAVDALGAKLEGRCLLQREQGNVRGVEDGDFVTQFEARLAQFEQGVPVDIFHGLALVDGEEGVDLIARGARLVEDGK